MRSLYNIINEVQINNMFEHIDSNLICESLQSSILQDIVKQIKDDEQDKKKAAEVRGYSFVSSSTSFKKIFGGRMSNVKWNEVKDSDFEISKADFDKENKKEVKARNEMIKKLRVIVKNDANAIAILKNPKTGKFAFVYDIWGDVIRIYDNNRETGYRGRHGSLNQSEKLAYAEEMDIYYLDLRNLSSADIKRERSNRKYGAVAMYNEYELKQIAKENIKRYKEIIAKNKAERLAKSDNISKEVSEITQKVLEISEKINGDIIKYADCVSDLSSILSMIYDKRTYIPGNRCGTYKGVDGLLYCYANYISSKKDSLMGNYKDMYQKENTVYRSKIEELLEKIWNKIESLETKL